MILWVVFRDQEHEPALHLNPTVPALMPALMLTNEFARGVSGVAKFACVRTKQLTMTDNYFGYHRNRTKSLRGNVFAFLAMPELRATRNGGRVVDDCEEPAPEP